MAPRTVNSEQPSQRLSVEVAYALRDRQVLIALDMEAGSTVRGAIERSGLLAQFPEIDLVQDQVGVFGKLVELDTLLRDGDRVEIYRPLIADPRDARREKVRRSKTASRR